MNRRELLKTLPVAAGAAITAGPVSVAMAGENVGRSLLDDLHDEFYQYSKKFGEFLKHRKIRASKTFIGIYYNTDVVDILDEFMAMHKSNFKFSQPIVVMGDDINSWFLILKGSKSYFVGDEEYEFTISKNISIPKQSWVLT